jgi:hypothetical protein
VEATTIKRSLAFADHGKKTWLARIVIRQRKIFVAALMRLLVSRDPFV